jgi:membrane associated rhomboid family serine protease
MWQSSFMSKADVVIADALSSADAQRVALLFSAMQIEFELDADESRSRASIRVHAADADRARRLILDEFPFGIGVQAGRLPDRPRDLFADSEAVAPPAWFGRGAAAVIGLAVACAAWFAWLVLGPGGAGAEEIARSRFLEFGAVHWGRVQSGEYWRLLSACFLHFNIGHLVTNMGVLLLIGPPLAHQVGGPRFLALFAATGVAGNIASHLIMPTTGLKAGASGGIAGILGALGGHAIRNPDRSRFKTWQRLGALAACYGLLIGFGPGRDNVAHMGGMLSGLVLGWLTPPLPDPFPQAAPRAPAGPPR